ncbi:DNA polymerase III subunit delta [Devosia pacifica]|uniref:DNA-directed DNA polymerase n=1 Tax=Devosia pacifica TaxID=1335967 RepID=A0A918S627_9HYPH|nr:DNA polymerase III subunit delta [Devosia pacifica]GHA23459.1 DNA polymerase III subunit delta [Devosia pacifica]
MTALKAHEVSKYVQRPDLQEGVFLVYGSDAGLVREYAQKLVRRFSEDGSDGDGPITLDPSDIDADPGRILVEARTPSLFGGHRVVRIRSATKSITTALSELCQDPSGAVVVVEAGNLPPRDALRALVEGARQGRALPCFPDTAETLATLIRETLTAEGIAFEPEVIPTLRDSLGNDREVTRRELEKLVLYAGESRSLTEADVLLLSGDNAMLAIDALLDATGTGHSEQVERGINRALSAATDPQRLLIQAMSHFSTLRRWRAAYETGRPAREILQSARPRPHFSRTSSLEQQIRLWDEPSLSSACNRLLKATEDSRRKPLLAETLVRRTLLSLCMTAATN